MAAPCPHCGCTSADDGGTHAMLILLDMDDLDAALTQGLLDAQPCPGCVPACNAQLIAARNARRDALAARTRYRASEARLQRRKAERDAARRPPATTAAAALPSAAADALARALAKARERRG